MNVHFNAFFLAFLYGLKELEGVLDVHINVFLRYGLLGASISVHS
jgi:hypothetical protein